MQASLASLAASSGSPLFSAPSSGAGSLAPSSCSQIGPTRFT
jgi:hypothetical protein